MIDYHKEIVATLQNILPTHYEMQLTSGTSLPCISYMELSNVDNSTGDTIGYSTLSFQVKVWAHSLQDLQNYSKQIDSAMRGLGFARVGSAELFNNQTTIMQKVLTYDALAVENY